jgi:GGDEF domain-containing protein
MEHNRLYLNFATLGVWLILASTALVWTGPNTIILTLALLAFTATLGLTNMFKNAAWVAAVLGVLVTGAVQYSVAGFTPNSWLGFGVSAIALIGTALLSNMTARQLQIIFGQLDRDQKLIDELRVYDPETGLLKWIYARQSLKTEITRSQRFHNDLCFMFIQVEHWDQPGEGFTASSLKELKTQISDIITSSLRTVDISFSSGKIGAILPGTRPEGAMIAAERVVENSLRKARVAVNIGIAHFPNDGITEEEIVKAAETALLVSINSDRSIVQFGQISSALEREVSSEQQPFEEMPQNNPDEANQPTDGQEGLTFGPDEIGLKICGVHQVSWTLTLENNLRKMNGIKAVRILEFSVDTLYLGVKPATAPLAQLLQKIPGLESSPVSEINSWITVTFQKPEQTNQIPDAAESTIPAETKSSSEPQ